MNAPLPEAIDLAALEIGGRGRIAPAASPDPVAPRLRDLGLVPGTRVELTRRGPLGDPVELELRGYRICLRGRDLAGLRVHLAPDA